jgi:murein DD-endopeptidase MepM/ murein hydrolase activator NlpD
MVRPLRCLALAVASAVLLAALPADAQRTPGLDETRARVQQLTQELSDAETELANLELETEAAGARLADLQRSADALVGTVVDSAVSSFLRRDAAPTMLSSTDVVAAMRADELANAALGADTDSIEQYRSVFEDLQIAGLDLADRVAEQQRTTDRLLAARDDLGVELARLEKLEAERLAAEARRRAAEAERARAAAAASSAASSSGATSVPVASRRSGTLQACPVAGAVSFVDSWGAGRSGGRRHKGVDMMASIGTPVVAPVGGSVTHRSNRVGGRSFYLTGNDGNFYYGTHLSGYGNAGSVSAGDVIGYVGDDGNARGIPHLHFEVHPGGGSAVNPYPYVAAVC